MKKAEDDIVLLEAAYAAAHLIPVGLNKPHEF